MKNIKDFTLPELQNILVSLKQKEFHAKQIFSWIYQKGAGDFKSMSDIPLELRRKLEETFEFSALKIIRAVRSLDGTQKFLFELADKDLIEAVSIPAQERVTGCVSTQAGCKYACSFCASGLSGFKRNLSTAEIIDELMVLKEKSGGKLTHVVFMGTGEPLDNYGNVFKAIRIINSPPGLNIGARRITVSTCGIIPGIKQMAEEGLQIELSVSLHAADDKLRSRLLPVNRKYPLKELIAACKDYINLTGRQVTFEYILIKGLNSDLQNAQKLSTILKGMLAKVNLIPANPVKEQGIEPPAKPEILLFRDNLKKAGINVTLRRPRGQDIEAACGQLRIKYEKKQLINS